MKDHVESREVRQKHAPTRPEARKYVEQAAKVATPLTGIHELQQRTDPEHRASEAGHHSAEEVQWLYGL